MRSPPALFAALWLVAACAGSPAPPPPPAARHAVIILLDATRADVLAEVHAPRIASLAASGLRVERAWATATWTCPSVVSLFTGAFVRTHGWDLATGALDRYPPLPALPTLAEVLGDAGFTRQGLHANVYLAEDLGFDRGFDEWRRLADEVVGQEVARRVSAWPGDGRRHFLYLHLNGPHTGLSPSPEARARWALDERWFGTRHGLLIDVAQRGRDPAARAAYRAAYRAVLEDTDRRVGDVLDALAPVRSETLVVLLADHGEELGELGVFGHGWSVAEPLLHVPLVVAGPGVAPGVRPTATLAEVADLLTDALGIDHPWPVQSPWQGPLAAERHGKLAILADGRWKGMWTGDAREVVDLRHPDRPPGPEAEAVVERARTAWLDAVPAGPPAAGGVPLDPRAGEALGELGYLGAPAVRGASAAPRIEPE